MTSTGTKASHHIPKNRFLSMRSDFGYIQAINEIENNNYGQATSGYGSAKLQLARTAFPSCTRAICAYKNDRRKVNSSNSIVCTG